MNPTEETPEPEESPEERGRRMDPDILLIQRLTRTLEEAPEESRLRAMCYLAIRYLPGVRVTLSSQ